MLRAHMDDWGHAEASRGMSARPVATTLSSCSMFSTCIYCASPSGNPSGVEHVLPEALGNPDWVLPRGAVCDPCNARFGSNIDTPFVTQGIGAAGQVFGVPGKKGLRTWTVPKAAKFEADFLPPRDDGRQPRIKTIRTSNPKTLKLSEMGEPTASFNLNVPMASPEVHSKFMSRLLLATVASQVNPEAALAPLFDPHRLNMTTGSLPVSAKPIAVAGNAAPAWAVYLLAEVVVLELWNIFRLGIRHDGREPLVEHPTGIHLDLPNGPVVKAGGPHFWPEEYLKARTGKP